MKRVKKKKQTPTFEIEKLESRQLFSQTFDSGGLRFESDLIDVSGSTATITGVFTVFVGFTPSSNAENYRPLLEFEATTADGSPSFIIKDDAADPTFTVANYNVSAIIPNSHTVAFVEFNNTPFTWDIPNLQSLNFDGVKLNDASSETVTGMAVAGFDFMASNVFLYNPNGTGADTSTSQVNLQGVIDLNATLNDATTILPDIVVNTSNYVYMSPSQPVALNGASFTTASKSVMALKSLGLTNIGFTALYSHADGHDNWTIEGTGTLQSLAQDSSGKSAFTLTANIGASFTDGNFSAVTFGVSGGFSLFVMSMNSDSSNPLTATYNFSKNQWDLSGAFTIEFNGNSINTVLGYTTDPTTPGMIIVDGVVTSVYATVAADFTFFGTTFKTTGDGVVLQYNRDTEYFALWGNMEMLDKTSSEAVFSVHLGSGDTDAGFLIHNGSLLEFDVAVSSSEFGAGNLHWGVNNAGLKWTQDNGDDVFVIYGTLTVTDIWSLQVTLGNTTGGSNGGLEIKGGDFFLENFQVVLSNVSVGFLVLKDFELGYQQNATTGDEDVSLGGTVYFPECTSALEASMVFDATKDAITSFSINMEFGLTPLAIGSTGLFLVAAGVEVQNCNSPADFIITGNVAVQYGTTLNLLGADATMVAATGSVTVSRNEFVLDGKVIFGAKQTSVDSSSGLPIYTAIIGSGSGSVNLNWGSHQYSMSVGLDLYDGVFEVDADFQFDGTASNYSLYISADAKVKVPSIVPFIGGTTLASLNFVFDYQSIDPATGHPIGYAAAWIKLDFLVTNVYVGFLVDINDNSVSSPELIGRHTIDEIKDGTYVPPTKLYTYSQTFSVPTGSDITEFQVTWPEVQGTQTVGYEFVPTGSDASAGSVTNQSSFSGDVSILANPAGPYASSTLTTQILNPQLEDAGSYTYYLFSTEKFDATKINWQFTYSIPVPTVTIADPPDSTYTDPTITLSADYSVGTGLASQTTINFYYDTDGSGYDGVKIASIIPTDDTGTVTATWTVINLPSQSYRIYATINDGVNSTVQSVYSTTTNFVPTGPISGYIYDSVNKTGVSDLQVFLDVNADGVFNPSVDPEWTTNSAGYYRFDYSDVAQKNHLSDNASYRVGLITPAGVTFQPGGTAVDLSSYYNRIGIYDDGATFPSTGGFDGAGNAYSSLFIGSTLTWNNVTFQLGSPGVNNVVSATGQTIPIADVQATSIQILAAATNGPLPFSVFTIDFTDGVKVQFQFGISDWTQASSYSGESTVLAMPYALDAAGAHTTGGRNLYGYSLVLPSEFWSSTIQDITLPNQSGIEFLGILLSGGATTNPQYFTVPAALISSTTFNTIVNTSIAGFVFNDNNQNGIFDSTDTGASGWTVYADLNMNGSYDSNEPTGFTDAQGEYRIFNLSPTTTYDIRLYQDPVTHSNFFTTSSTLLTQTTSDDTTELISNQNFGILEYATVSGVVSNYNLLADGNLSGATAAPAIPWTVSLQQNGTTVQTVSVDTTDGSYTFTKIVPGTYTILESTPAGWLQISPIVGTYNFASAVDLLITTNSTIISFVNADFDGDGFTDIAILSTNGNSLAQINFYLNDGAGNFTATPVTYSGVGSTITSSSISFNINSSNPYKMVAFDGMTGATHTSLGIFSREGSLYLVTNQSTSGKLNFTASTTPYLTLTDETTFSGLTTADFNNDGITDFAVSYRGFNAVAVHLMPAADSSFSAYYHYSALGSVAAGDLNLDGKMDLVALADGDNGQTIQVLYGNGDGTFTTPQSYAMNTSPENITYGISLFNGASDMVTIGDINGDGLPDIVAEVIDFNNANYCFAQFYEQQAVGGFVKVDDSNWISQIKSPFTAVGIAVARVLGGSNNNFVSADNGDNSGNNWRLNFYGDGYQDLFADSSSSAQLSIPLALTPIGIMSFDANYDGLPDFFVIENGHVIEILNQSPRTTNITLTLTPGESTADNNFTNAQTKTAPSVSDGVVILSITGITGVVYDDANLSGTRQSTEPGLAGVLVFLDSNGNSTLDSSEFSTITNDAGAFAFSDIPDGTYTLTARPPLGFLTRNISTITRQVIVENGQITSSDGSLIELGMTAGQRIIKYTNSVDAGVEWTLRKNGAYIELVDDNSGALIRRDLISSIYSYNLFASNFTSDSITIDFSFDGSFSIPGGIHIDGGRDGRSGGSIIHLIGTSAADSFTLTDVLANLDGILNVAWTPNIAGVFINTGDGDDSISISGKPTDAGTLSIDGGTGQNSFILSGSALADVITLNADRAVLNGMEISLAHLNAAIIQPGAGDDLINLFTNLLSTPATRPAGFHSITVNDTAGNDTYIFDTRAIEISLTDTAGTDSLDFSRMSTAVAVDLSLFLGQSQPLGLSGNSLSLTGTFENLTGTPFADTLTGNDADNIIHGGSGNDLINGKSGNDALYGEGGDDHLIGGSGNDVLVGADGNNTLEGNDGTDVLIGGNGHSTLSGGPGDDLLIAGTTAFDADPIALGAISAEWSSEAPYEERVADLRGDSSSAQFTNRRNGDDFLNPANAAPTVLDNGQTDELAGDTGRDFYFVTRGPATGDLLSDASPNETIVVLAGVSITGDDGLFVDAVYRTLLDRPADPLALDNFTPPLDQARQPAMQQVATTILNSAEGLTSFLDEPTTGLYITLLHRRATQPEINDYLAYFASGATREQVISIFVGSAEFFTLNGTTDSQFLNAAYMALLGRPIDPMGQAAFTQQLDAARAAQSLPTSDPGTTSLQPSRTAIAAQILASPECITRTITLAYQNILDRTPDALGLDAWSAQLAGGLRTDVFYAALYASAEYVALAGSTTRSWLLSLYTSILNRPADSGGLNTFYHQILDSYTPARAATLASIQQSTEYRTRAIESLYARFLGRTPGADEVDGWLNQLATGTNYDQLEAAFISSAEYFARAGNDNATWVKLASLDLLNAIPDDSVVAADVDQLTSGITRATLATQLITSHQAAAVLVQQVYAQLLNRSASIAETNEWIDVLNSGGTPNQLISTLAASDEFYLSNNQPT